MRIGLFGTGAFGLALSSILTDNNHEIVMWTKFIEEKKLLDKEKTNDVLLKGYYLKNNIKITTDIRECIEGSDLLIVAIPVPFMESLFKSLTPFIKDNHIIIASKGINENNLLPSDLVKKYLNTENYGILGGPTFAVDVIEKKPLAFTLAVNNDVTRELTMKAFANNYVKIKTTKDIRGVELSGALKNVYAIISGVLEGLSVTDSTKALFFSEALYDLCYILDKLDADVVTAMSYAGLGDFLLTCSSTNSRNYSFGKLIGEGCTKEAQEEFLKKTTTEGYHTLKYLLNILNANNISVPIINKLDDIINNREKPEKLLEILMLK